MADGPRSDKRCCLSSQEPVPTSSDPPQREPTKKKAPRPKKKGTQRGSTQMIDGGKKWREEIRRRGLDSWPAVAPNCGCMPQCAGIHIHLASLEWLNLPFGGVMCVLVTAVLPEASKPQEPHLGVFSSPFSTRRDKIGLPLTPMSSSSKLDRTWTDLETSECFGDFSDLL